jgi:RND family efflux transporter MFP subunit
VVEIPLAVTLAESARLLPAVESGRRPTVALAASETSEPQWQGEVVRISPQADEQTRTVQIFVEVDNHRQSTPLLPGTFVHARIEGPVLTDVMVVPRDAVLTGKSFVDVDGRAQRRVVTIDRTLHGLAIVADGLNVGERVILTNLDVMYDGAPVSRQLERTVGDELRAQRTAVARLLD